jgi:hypothetical protein
MGMGWAAGAGRAAVCFGRRRAERVWVWVRVRVWVWVWVWVWAGEAMPASRVVWPCLKMVPWASVEGAEMAWLQRGWSGLVWQDGCNLVRLAVSAVWPSAGVCARRAVDQRRGVGGWRMVDGGWRIADGRCVGESECESQSHSSAVPFATFVQAAAACPQRKAAGPTHTRRSGRLIGP